MPRIRKGLDVISRFESVPDLKLYHSKAKYNDYMDSLLYTALCAVEKVLLDSISSIVRSVLFSTRVKIPSLVLSRKEPADHAVSAKSFLSTIDIQWQRYLRSKGEF